MSFDYAQAKLTHVRGYKILLHNLDLDNIFTKIKNLIEFILNLITNSKIEMRFYVPMNLFIKRPEDKCERN